MAQPTAVPTASPTRSPIASPSASPVTASPTETGVTPAPTAQSHTCTPVSLAGVLGLVDVYSDVGGAASSTSAIAYSGASATQLSVPSAAAATSGSLLASVHTAGLGAAGFSVAAARAASVAAVLRTPTVYEASDGVHDRERVRVAVQLRDASGNSAVLHAGLGVALELSGASATLSAACSLHAVASGLATCTRSVPGSWFSASAGSASAVVKVTYAGVSGAVATASAGSVALAASPVHSALSASGMTLALPTSPRFAGDALDAALTASLIGVGYGLRAWTVTLRADRSALTLSSHSVDSVWGDAQVTQTDAGSELSLSVLVNSPASDVSTNTAVQGSGIKVLVARLRVKGGAAAGTYGVSLAVDAMLNFGGFIFVEDGHALALDHRSGGSASGAGELVVESRAWRGLFAYAPGGRAVVSNTAPVTGGSVTVGALTAMRVSSRPHASSFEWTSKACSSGSGALSLAGCVVQLSAGAAAGGAATVQVAADGLTASVPFDVWHPGTLSLAVDAAQLGRFDGCASRYEWTRLRLRAGELDVTPLLAAGDLGHDDGVQLAYVSAAAGTSRVLVEGVAAGSADVWLSAQQGTVRVSVLVSATATVEIASLSAHLVTGLSGPSLTPSTLSTASSAMDVAFALEQRLDSEGDSGQVASPPNPCAPPCRHFARATSCSC